GAAPPAPPARPASAAAASNASTAAAAGRRTRRSGDRDHALEREPGPCGGLLGHRHLVTPLAQRVAQLLERDYLHVAADRPLGDRLEELAGRLLVQPVQDADLGGDEEAPPGRAARELDHPLG